VDLHSLSYAEMKTTTMAILAPSAQVAALVCSAFIVLGSRSVLGLAYCGTTTRHRFLTTRRETSLRSSGHNHLYGRGSEIWPPSNGVPVKLKDSFPNGTLPDHVRRTLQQIGAKVEHKPREWRQLLPRAIRRILRRAAKSQEEEAFHSPEAPPMDKTPAMVALGLLCLGYIRPLDILLVTFLTGYVGILHIMAQSLRADAITPTLPALPPQGHVPTLVSNPLGHRFTYSVNYDRWLKLGVWVGLLGPVLLLVKYALDRQLAPAQACARPLFFLCCQALSEAISRRIMTPLPLRIFLPVAYNAMRLGYLWSWSLSTEVVGVAGRVLAIANLMYWCANLFGFLLPVATLRYMRAHFFCVEAEQVLTRPGMEDSIGLVSPS
jgi:hypothetical protein